MQKRFCWTATWFLQPLWPHKHSEAVEVWGNFITITVIRRSEAMLPSATNIAAFIIMTIMNVYQRPGTRLWASNTLLLILRRITKDFHFGPRCYNRDGTRLTLLSEITKKKKAGGTKYETMVFKMWISGNRGQWSLKDEKWATWTYDCPSLEAMVQGRGTQAEPCRLTGLRRMRILRDRSN